MSYFLDEAAYQDIRHLIELASGTDKLGQEKDLYFLLDTRHVAKDRIIAKIVSRKGLRRWLLLCIYCKNPLRLYWKMLCCVYKGIKNALSEEFWQKEVRLHIKYKPKIEKKQITYLYN